MTPACATVVHVIHKSDKRNMLNFQLLTDYDKYLSESLNKYVIVKLRNGQVVTS